MGERPSTAAIRAEAESLNDLVLAEAAPWYPRDDLLAAKLEAAFGQACSGSMPIEFVDGDGRGAEVAKKTPRSVAPKSVPTPRRTPMVESLRALVPWLRNGRHHVDGRFRRAPEANTFRWPRLPRGWSAQNAGRRGSKGERLSSPEARARAGGSRARRTLPQQGKDAFERGDFVQAEALLQRAIANGDANPWTWVWLSRTQLQRGRFEDARTSVVLAMALQPDWPPAVLQLADVHAAAGHHGPCLAVLDEALLTFAEDANVLRQITKRCRTLPAYPQALRAADELLRRSPGDKKGVYTKALSLWEIGDHEAAMRVVEQWRLLLPRTWVDELEIRYRLARSEPALAFGRLAALEYPLVDRALLAEIADSLWENGCVLEASLAYERAAAANPADSAVRVRRDAVVGEARVLLGGWTPPILAAGERDRQPAKSVLLVTATSLPFIETVDTMRTHSMAQELNAAGFTAEVVTLLPFPWNLNAAEVPLCEEIDGVVYRRLLPSGPLSSRLDEQLSLSVSYLAPLIEYTKPAVLLPIADTNAALVATAIGTGFGIPVAFAWGDASGRGPHAHASQAGSEREHDRLRADLSVRAALAADLVFTATEAERQSLLRRGVSAGSVTVVAASNGAAYADLLRSLTMTFTERANVL